MKTPNLFDVPKDRPTRKERIQEFKAENWIWTHKAEMMEDRWSALAYAHSLEALKGYDLTGKLEPEFLIAGYCRLLDEAGLLVTGKTEMEAIRTLCRNLNINCPL